MSETDGPINIEVNVKMMTPSGLFKGEAVVTCRPIHAPPQKPVEPQHPTGWKPELPQELACLVQLDEVREHWIINPITHLGKENFSRIADIIRQYGGAYVRADISRNVKGHFEIPK